MKKMNKKVISLILAVLMVFGTMATGIGSIDFSSFAIKASAVNCNQDYTSDDDDGFIYRFEDTLDRVYISGTEDTISGDVVVNDTAIIDGNEYDVIALGSNAFEGRTNVTSVTLSQNIREIREYAFKDCTSLKYVALDEYDHLLSIGIYAFYNCSSLLIIGKMTVEETEETNEDGTKSTVTTTDYSFTLDSVKSIGEYAFYNCSNLNFLFFPQATYIGSYAFCKSGIYQLMLPYGITVVNDYAFADCKNLFEAEYEGEITSIGEHAFDGCYKLGDFIYCDYYNNPSAGHSVEAVNSLLDFAEADYSVEYEVSNTIKIPSDCTSVGKFAFFNCDTIYYVDNTAGATLGMAAVSAMNNLRGFTADGSKYTTDGVALYSADGKTLIQFALAQPATTYDIKSGVETIDDYAFYGSSNLRTVNIPDSVKEIGESAFNSSLALSTVYTTSSSSLKKIDELAFANCPKLEEIYVPFSIYSGTVDDTSYVNSYTGGTITVYAQTSMSDTTLATKTDEKAKFEALFPKTDIVYLTSDKVIITFDLNGGAVESSEGDVVEIFTKGYTVTAPDAKKAGYVLYSWTPSIDESTTAEESTTYYAVWIPEAHSDHNIVKKVKYDETGHWVDLYCSDCSIIVTRGTTFSHNLVKGTVTTVDPTCTESGSVTTEYSCTECGYTESSTVTTPAKGHNYVQTTGKAPTCTEDGYGTQVCSRCNDTITSTIPATGHTVGSYEEAPTCTDAGIAVCASCGTEFAVPATGHTDSNGDGACDVCGEEIGNADIDQDLRISIATPSTVVIPYGHSLVLTAKTNKDIPLGYSVVWSVISGDGNVEISVSDDGMTCEVKADKAGTATVMAELCDASGYTATFANGKTVSDTLSVETNVTLFTKIINFFKTIFFMSKKIY